MKTKYLLITLVLVAALLLVGCSAEDASVQKVPEGAQAGDLVDLQPCTYEAGDIEYSADCGTLVVSENRSDPDSRLIALPVIRVHALSDSPAEPIFWLAGGPGQTNMHFQYLEGLVDRHDFVQVGYRGVDGSVVLDCPEVTKAWRGVGSDLFSNESFANIGQAFAACHTRLQGEGIDLDGYTLPEVIEDMQAARAGLGYERVNLISASYGTRVAMFYASLYPDNIYRSLMYAVNPPGHFVWEPEVIDEMIAHDAELCAHDPVCSARTDDLAETMRSVTDNMPPAGWSFRSTLAR